MITLAASYVRQRSCVRAVRPCPRVTRRFPFLSRLIGFPHNASLIMNRLVSFVLIAFLGAMGAFTTAHGQDLNPRFGLGFNTSVSTADGVGIGMRLRGSAPVNRDLSFAIDLGMTGFIFEGRDEATYLVDPQISAIVSVPDDRPDRLTYFMGGQRDEMPRRLVLHKSSNFLDDETKGFADGAADVKTKEFITVRKRHPLRLFGQGDNPPLRGTLAIPPGEREYYLYTTGFVPEQSVYNNPGTPKPLVLRPHPEYFSGDYHRICEEILKFTKLDWNSSDFCKRLPVTIGIADAVSDILAEPAASNINLQTHYYYYM